RNQRISISNVRLPEFIRELEQRWDLAPERTTPHVRRRLALLPEPEMPDYAIFISYATRDFDTVIELKRHFDRAGLYTWFDRERLKAGENWHNTLHDQVDQKCFLFVSVVSSTTESTPTSYYHEERAWAKIRAERNSPIDPFYVAVRIDDGPLQFQRE